MGVFDAKTYEVILEQMKSNVRDGIDKREGSVVHDMLAPAALEAELAYIELDAIIELAFAQTSEGVYLDRRVAELGITRKPSVKATGSVTFTGTDDVVVPIGTRLVTNDLEPIYFVTTAEGTIASGTITVTAEAEVGGVAGNVGPSRIITLVAGNLSGITTVTNSTAFDGGVDEESDGELLDRYLDRVRKPATSGNANQYVQWAREVIGVSDAKVYPLWNGPGTVKVVLLDEEKTAPPTSVVTAVQNYLDPTMDGTGQGVAPIGAKVTVAPVVEVPINVSATITITGSVVTADVLEDFTESLKAYLADLAFVDSTVRYSQIASLILDVDGVVDYTNLTVNGGTANVVITDGSVAIAGTVVF